MRKFLLIGACVLLSATGAFADHGRNGRGHSRKRHHYSQGSYTGYRNNPADRYDQGDNRYRGDLPPGLAKRRGNLPPGLEKKREDGYLPPGLEKRRY